MKVRQREFWFNDAHSKPLPNRPIYVDGFAGGGGASEGFRRALGFAPDVAINHDEDAIAMHMANHPKTKHYCENIWNVEPMEACEGRQVAAAWFSPDCTHFSKALGDKPVKKEIRGLAWVVIKWAEMPKHLRPRVIFMENVEEFQTWGPVDRKTNKPIKAKAGVTFELWLWKLRELGYEVEWRILTASDYGAPTTRKRLFLVARCDGKPIVWPSPTHGGPKQIAKEIKTRGYSRRKPWRTAAEIIDWSIPCPSIFLSPEEAKDVGCNRPLAPKTMHRIAEGIRRYVIETPSPYIVRVNHGGEHFRGQSILQPIGTVTSKNGYGLVDPVLAPFSTAAQQGGQSRRLDEPHRTICASHKDQHCVVASALSPFVTSSAYTGSTGRGKYIYSMEEPIRTITNVCDKVLVTPTMISYYGPKEGNHHRGRDLREPLPTQTTENRFGLVASHIQRMYGNSVGSSCSDPLGTTTSENKSALVAAFIAKHFGGVIGIPANQPFPTITAVGTQNQIVTANLIKNNHGAKQWFDVHEPVRTIMAQGTHHAVVQCRAQNVRAFLMKYYSTGGQWAGIDQPLPTITAKDRLCLGLVLLGDELWQIVDIGMRMLTPRELFNAQGFPTDYQIETTYLGKPASKKVQVGRCGNSVSPHPAEALIRANLEVAA